MKLHIENFGPIQKGEIDLTKRFYTFVGYNNSGKTYMSQLLWEFDAGLQLSENEILLDNIRKNGFVFEMTESFISNLLEKNVKQLAQKKLSDLLKIPYEHFLVSQLSIKYQDSYLDKVKELNFRYVFSFSEQEHIILKKKNNSFSVLIEEVTEYPENLSEKELDRNNYSFIPEKLRGRLLSTMLENIVWKSLGWFSTTSTAMFLPANRTFFPTYYKEVYQSAKNAKELASEEIRRNPNSSKLKDLLKPNSTKTTDELTQKILFDKYIETNYYTDLVEDLEEIMGGKITTREAEVIAPVEFQFEMNDAEKSKLDLYLASSSVNQLTTLYLYLKYWASEHNNFLFIDEPEENLHPSNQIKLVNLLMKFANRNNNRVLVSTHSSFVAEMINNYAQIAYLQEEGKDVKEIIDKNKLDIQTIENLKHQDFGVYFFNGETMREYPVEEYGAFFRDFYREDDKVKEIKDYLNDAVYQNLQEQKEKKHERREHS